MGGSHPRPSPLDREKSGGGWIAVPQRRALLNPPPVMRNAAPTAIRTDPASGGPGQSSPITAIEAAVMANWLSTCARLVVNERASNGAGFLGTTMALPGGTWTGL